MVTKQTLITFVILSLGWLTQQSSCKKTIDCAKNRYLFSAPFLSASSNSDSIKISDTLWFRFECSTTLKDELTGLPVNYARAADMGTAISISKYDSLSKLFSLPSAQRFKTVVQTGVELKNRDTALIKEFGFREAGDKYQFAVGFIPRESGKYLALFSDATYVYRQDDHCTNATYQFSFSTDQHRYMNPNFPGGAIPPSRDFYFVVKK